MRRDRSRVTSWMQSGMLHKYASRVIPVAPEIAWRVMTDHAGYADVADNLSRVETVFGNGLGMCRRCYDTRGCSWSETCILWEEGQAYAFSVHTDAPDYPYPLAELTGFWRVEPVTEGSKVSLEFVARAKWGIVGLALLRILIGPAERICLRLLERWEGIMLVKQHHQENQLPADDTFTGGHV